MESNEESNIQGRPRKIKERDIEERALKDTEERPRRVEWLAMRDRGS